MAFKMKGFNPGEGTGMSSAFHKENEKNLKYRDPAEFSGPGEYIKHTGKWMGSGIKKGVRNIVSGATSLGGMLGKEMKKMKDYRKENMKKRDKQFEEERKRIFGKGKEGSAMKKAEDNKPYHGEKRYEGPNLRAKKQSKGKGPERMEFATQGDEDRYFELLDAGKDHRGYMNQETKKEWEITGKQKGVRGTKNKKNQ